MRVGLYIRVSTTEQAEGFSLEAQNDHLRKIADAHGHIVVDEYIDVSSGKTIHQRKEYQRMIRDSETNKFDGIMTYKLDRLHRDTLSAIYFANDLRLKGKDLIITTQSIDTSTPVGRAMYGMIAIFAELESANTAERSALGTAKALEEGKLCHRPKKLLTPYQLEKAINIIGANPDIGQNELARHFTTISKNPLINNLCDLDLWIRGQGAIKDRIQAVIKGGTSEYIKNLEKKGAVIKGVLTDQSESYSETEAGGGI